MEDLRKQANDLLCYYGKMQNRLSQVGVGGAASLVELFNQLQQGLDAVSLEELDPAIQEVNRLVGSLSKMQADLQVLKELKASVEKTRVVLRGAQRVEEPARANANGGPAG